MPSGVLDKSTQGWPGKYSLCFAEEEAASPWEPLHVSRGLPADRSAVTVYAAESGHNVLSHGTSDPSACSPASPTPWPASGA